MQNKEQQQQQQQQQQHQNKTGRPGNEAKGLYPVTFTKDDGSEVCTSA